MTKKIFQVILVLLTLIILSNHTAIAADSDVEVISETSPRFLVGDVILNKTGLKGDNFFIAKEVEIIKPVEGDVFIIGGKVKIDAPINGDLRVIAESLEIRSQISGSVAMVTSTTYISSTGEIDGDVYGVTEKLIHEGRIGNNLNLGFSPNSEISISGKVLGDFYYTESRPNISDSAFIEGEMKKIEITTNQNSENRLNTILGRILHTISVILLGLFVLWISPKSIKKIVANFEKNPIKNAGIGLLALISLPFILLMLLISLIGIPLALLITTFTMFVAYISPFFGGIWIGKKIFNTNKLNLWHAVLGVFLFDVISILPLLGTVLNLLVLSILLGILVNYLFKKKTKPANEKK